MCILATLTLTKPGGLAHTFDCGENKLRRTRYIIIVKKIEGGLGNILIVTKTNGDVADTAIFRELIRIYILRLTI